MYLEAALTDSDELRSLKLAVLENVYNAAFVHTAKKTSFRVNVIFVY